MDNNTLAYTISVEGIEDILAKIGQLEKALSGVGDKFAVVAKQSGSMEVTIEETTKSLDKHTDTINETGMASKSLSETYSKLFISYKNTSQAADGAEKSTTNLKGKQDQLAQSTKTVETNIEESTKSIKEQTVALDGDSASYTKVEASASKFSASQKTVTTAVGEANKALEDTGKEGEGVKKTYETLKAEQEKLITSMKNLNLASNDDQKEFKESAEKLADLNREIGELDQKLSNTKTPIEQFKEGFSANLSKVKESFGNAAEGVEALRKVASDLGADDVEAFSKVVGGADTAISAAKVSMEAFSGTTKIVTGLFNTYKSVVSGVNTVVALYRSGTLASTIAAAAFNVVLEANPIGAIIAAIAGLIAAGAALFAFFKGSKDVAGELNKELDAQNAAFDLKKEKVAEEIELMKAQGKSEEEIAAKKRQLKQDEVNDLAEQEARAQKALEEASKKQKAEIQKRLDDIKAKRQKAANDLNVIDAQAATDKINRENDATDNLKKLQNENIKNQQEREIAFLKDRYEAEKADYKKRFGDAEDFQKNMKELDKKYKRELDEIAQKYADHRTAVQKLNDDITKLSDKAINEFIAKGDVSATTLSNIAKKMNEVNAAQTKLQEGLAKTPESINAQIEAIDKQYAAIEEDEALSIQIINASSANAKEKAKEIAEIKAKNIQAEIDLIEKKAKLDNVISDDEAKRIDDLKKDLKQYQDLLNGTNETPPKENDKPANTKETNDYKEQIKEIDKFYAVKEKYLKSFASDEKEKLSISAQLTKERYEKELALVEKKRDAILETANADGELDENAKASLDELTQKASEYKVEVDKAKKAIEDLDKSKKKSGLESLGASKEAADAFNEVLKDFQAVATATLDIVKSIFELQKQDALNAIQEQEDKEIEAVNNSTLSEKKKAEQIEKIKKSTADKTHKVEVEAKKKQQKLDIATSIINTAIAVGKALGSAVFPVNVILAALAAVQGGVQTAIIARQKFAKGGMIPFAEGGMIEGASHAQGGVPFTSGGRMMEAEGGELIVNRNIWSRPDFVRSISAMNAHTGGRRFFADGGVVPTPSVPGVYVGSAYNNQPVVDTEGLVKGLRGVIASEVGSLQVVNNVVDTSDQQTRLLNQQTTGSF